MPQFKDTQHLSFREELHAIEAVIAGQGIGVFSDVLVARELAAGTLVKAFTLSPPGYGFHVVSKPSHSRTRTIRAFSQWLRSFFAKITRQSCGPSARVACGTK